MPSRPEPGSSAAGNVVSAAPQHAVDTLVRVDADRLKAHVRDIADYPKPGIIFKDITPLLGAPEVFAATVDELGAPYGGERIDKVIGIEARGFVFAAPVAYHLAAGFVPVRKPGKLPWEIEREEYALEYGTDLLEIHRDAVDPGERVLIVDDVIATGGTAAATARLTERLGGEVAGFAFVLELGFLHGRNQIAEYPIHTVVSYD